MIDNDVIRDIAAERKYWFIPLDLGRADILPSDNQEWCGVWLHGALLSIDTRAVFNPARNMVQSLYNCQGLYHQDDENTRRRQGYSEQATGYSSKSHYRSS